MRFLSYALFAASVVLSPLSATAQSGVVKLGVIGSLTGPHSGWDSPASEGVRMAVSEINAKGGLAVGGKKYTFSIVEEDAQSKPDVAASAAQKLLSDDDIRFVVGVLTSTPGVPVANQMARAKVLYIGGFTAMDGLVGTPGKELMLRALASDAIVAKGFVPAAKSVLEARRIGMLLPNDDVSKSIVDTYTPLFKQNGVEVVMVEHFQPGTTDFAPVLRKFQNQQLDSMFIGYSDPDAEAIIRQSLEVGGLPKKFAYRGGSGAPALKYANQIDAFLWQILTRDLASPSDDKVKEWIGRYKAFTKKDVSAQTYWALTFYDSIFMLAKAIEQAGAVNDPAAVATKLKGMRYDGVRRMSYDEKGHAITDIDIGILKSGKSYSVVQKIL